MDTACENCGLKNEQLQRCKGCFKVFYCSKNCQKIDWKNRHRAKCKISREPECTEKEKNGKTPDTKCASCGSGENLKKCANCFIVNYCSKRCQRQHWAVHKKACTASENSFDDVITTDGFKKQLEKEKIEKERMETFSMGFQGGMFNFGPSAMFKTDFADLSLRRSTTDVKRKQARVFAERKFPMQQIIDSIGDIPHGFVFWRSNLAIVAFMSRYHHYRGRHCVYIQDVSGDEIYVGFYLSGDSPYPHFAWSDIRPGRFIVLTDPAIHYFMDGSVGIRIDEGRNVFVFDI